MRRRPSDDLTRQSRELRERALRVTAETQEVLDQSQAMIEATRQMLAGQTVRWTWARAPSHDTLPGD